MAEQEKNCYLGISGKKHGPYSEKDILELYNKKKITGDVHFIRAGMKEWISLSMSDVIPPGFDDDGLPPLPKMPATANTTLVSNTKPSYATTVASASLNKSASASMPKPVKILFYGLIAGLAGIFLILGIVILFGVFGDGNHINPASTTVQTTKQQNSAQIAGFRISNLESDVLFGSVSVNFSVENITNQPIRAFFVTEIFNAKGEKIDGPGGVTDPLAPPFQPGSRFNTGGSSVEIADNPVYGLISVILFDETGMPIGFPDSEDLPPENKAFFNFLPEGKLAFLPPGKEPERFTEQEQNPSNQMTEQKDASADVEDHTAASNSEQPALNDNDAKEQAKETADLSGVITYKGIPVSDLMGPVDYVISLLGPPIGYDEFKLFYDDMEFYHNNDYIITIEIYDPSLFEVDGVTLDKNRADLIDILGEPGSEYEYGGNYYMRWWDRYDRDGCWIFIELGGPDSEAWRITFEIPGT